MEAFTALSDPVRAEIVQLLSGHDLTAGDIASRFPISRPAVSRHLSVLLKSRLVRVRGEAQRRVYSLDPRGLDEASRRIDECRRTRNRNMPDDHSTRVGAVALPYRDRNDLSLGGFVDRSTFRFVRRYPHPVELVWAALTDPQHLSVWLWPCTRFEARLGGLGVF